MTQAQFRALVRLTSTTHSYLHTPALATTLLAFHAIYLRSSFMVSTSESTICACWGYIGFSTDNKIGLPAAYFVEV
jgi:hypothetical protein